MEDEEFIKQMDKIVKEKGTAKELARKLMLLVLKFTRKENMRRTCWDPTCLCDHD